MASDPRPRAGSFFLVDQAEKIAFLLRRRGDQRERSKTRPSETVDGDPYVTTQGTLAFALGCSTSTVSRMATGDLPIPKLSIEKLCVIFQIESKALADWECHQFEAYYSFVRSGWSRLLDDLSARSGHVLIEPPQRNSRELIHRSLTLRPKSAMPEVVFDAPYWCFFECPSLAGSDQYWRGREMFLLNLNIRTDKLNNCNDLLGKNGLNMPIFPADGLFVFPPDGMEMTSPLEDVGQHAFICLAVVPDASKILALARRTHVPPGIDELARLIPLAVAKREVGIGVARYRVTVGR